MTWSKPRRLMIAGFASLVAATVVGGFAFAWVEQTTVPDGIWLAFTVVSTTGFGDGPTTVGGQAIAMVAFLWAAASYLVLLVGASAYGQLLAEERRRLQVISRRDVRQVVRGLHRN